MNNGILVSGESFVDVQEEEELGYDYDAAVLTNDDELQSEAGVQRMRARAHTNHDHDLTFDYDSIYSTSSSPSPSSPTTLTLPPGPIHIHTPSNTNNRRHLASYRGPKPVLAVKVIDKNGLQHPDSPKTISDKIFGTYGDSSTMTSQFAACSFNQLQIVPAEEDSRNNNDISDKLSDVGVLEVEIPVSIQSSSQGTIRKEVRKAIESKLGFGLPGGIDHVMVILEGCYVECGW